MKKFTRFLSGILLCAMALGGTSAFACAYNNGVVMPEDFVDPVYCTFMPTNWESKCNPDKTTVKGIKVLWVYYPSGSVLHASWTKKSKATGYDIQVSRYRNFILSDCMHSNTNSFSIKSLGSYVFKPKKHKTYYIRVRSTYKNGDPGPWSKAVKFKATKANATVLT